MKRLWLAGALFGAVILVCITAAGHRQQQTGALLAILDTVDEAVANEDIHAAHALAQSLCDEFHRRTVLFPCFMSHDDLSACRESIQLLPSILKDGNAEEFHMESARCRYHLNQLITEELPLWRNIL